MIIFDYIGHMVSTENATELHEFARKLGLRRQWYQTPGVSKRTGKVAKLGAEHHAHYDLTTWSMKEKARRMGAQEVDPSELVKRAWWSKARDDAV